MPLSLPQLLFGFSRQERINFVVATWQVPVVIKFFVVTDGITFVAAFVILSSTALEAASRVAASTMIG